MLRGKISSIFLDVDGTLSDDISWLKITESLGASKEKHISLFEKLKRGQINYEDAKIKLINLWQKTGNANQKFMEKTYRSWNLRQDANEIIDYLKKNYLVCLISGATDLYVQTVAEKLGVPDWFANTELIFDSKGNLIDFIYFQNQAEKKHEQFKEYIKKYKISQSKCAVIGDGDSDIVLFKELKYGIEVNEFPHSELQKLAWKSVRKLIDLKEIF
ncbi:hypothetical protein A2954_04025 [Candidatus Roizmanbacteria bacterium RIFCSPLOWO2_01_FULL_37_12]|uniref:phosphoserine phosphatase n=1 Tax=Candidatus Roizmanbacteria bacterium RIFCSPLOWO2_01_FULL_37_12 TaxID=1802056 RepID=A0A1F7IFL8_9BACT|nr:MAG: hypothetical protein A3D76_03685 [Candidatus Roizmanbacteria bacterium RIFCSPHIGHO2_02_FULL_37_9b]OGK42154.1 MAG: hypothetical protein A2954_04025 [Candidatus Roizmanbacteria bacterium RIFCSPLOWO2_01_FULL_37_12]